MVNNKRKAKFRTDFLAVCCKNFRILKATGLSAQFFWFLPRDLKKLTLIGQTYCVSETGHFERVFWSPWAKIKKSEPITLKPWEFCTDCKKRMILVQNVRRWTCYALEPKSPMLLTIITSKIMSAPRMTIPVIKVHISFWILWQLVKCAWLKWNIFNNKYIAMLSNWWNGSL